jgi:hypothetical protein
MEQKMTKIKFTTIAAAIALTSMSCASSVQASIYDFNIKLAFDSTGVKPDHSSHRGEMMAIDKGTFEGGHRGSYMITSNGEKLPVGEWVYWYPNGQKKLRAYYKLGIPHGRWMMWDETGTLRLQGRYSLGKAVGKWTLYYASGRKQHEGRFSNNLEVGHWIFWYPNGQKSMDGNYKYGEFHGTWSFYTPDGKVAFMAKYKLGRLVGKRVVKGE